MTKSNKILCVIGSILIAFVGLFGIIFTTQDDRVVKADEVVTNNYFSSSTFYSGVGYSTSGAASISQNVIIGYRFWLYVANGNWGTAGNYFAFNSFPLQGVAQPLFSEIVYDDWQWLRQLSFTYSSPNYYINLGYFVNTGFDINNIYKLNISSYSPAFGNNSLGAQTFTYYDTSERQFQVQIAYGLNYHFGVLSTRTYYFSPDLSDNQFYQAGLQEGMNREQSNIYDKGYNDAIDENKSNWERTGYNRGIADSNQYSFFNLIGAAFDVPIGAVFGFIDKDVDSPTYNQRVGGMLNFDLLGVNLRDFFFAILTFGIIIFVARLLLH